jgi:hypothetical protein
VFHWLLVRHRNQLRGIMTSHSRVISMVARAQAEDHKEDTITHNMGQLEQQVMRIS